MAKIVHRAARKVTDDQTHDAQRTMLDELFQDFYYERRKIYRVNFFRGIFFGLGSALGGSLVVALLLWVLSFFVALPLIGNYAQNARDTLAPSSQQNR